jgi:serine protease inhibitor
MLRWLNDVVVGAAVAVAASVGAAVAVVASVGAAAAVAAVAVAVAVVVSNNALVVSRPFVFSFLTETLAT